MLNKHIIFFFKRHKHGLRATFIVCVITSANFVIDKVVDSKFQTNIMGPRTARCNCEKVGPVIWSYEYSVVWIVGVALVKFNIVEEYTMVGSSDA